jgi:riboflavin synthase
MMKEEWLFSGAYVPADAETTAALVAEIKRLIDVVGGMALTQRPWVGLTHDDMADAHNSTSGDVMMRLVGFARAIEAKLKEKNCG